MSVLVTTASSVKSLIITRSLRKKDIEVVNTGSELLSPTFYSRYSSKRFLSPDPKKFPQDFLKSVLKYIKKEKIDVLFPVNSTETLLISKYMDKFTSFTNIPFEKYIKMKKIHNKLEFAKFASELGIPFPNTYFIEDVCEIGRIAEKMNYPVVIKLQNTSGNKGMSYAYSKDEFITKYKHTISKYDLKPKNYPIVQEYIPGTGYGVSMLFNHGDLRAIFVHKRLRECPITGGPSTLRISVRHPKMEKIATNILSAIEWHGIAMVEFKLDSRTKKPYVLEVNPRFWGSVNQAISAGVDFPYLLYKMAMDGDVEPVFDYKLGVKTRYLLPDLRSLYGYIKASNNGWKHIKEFFQFFGRDLYYDDISFTDPLPFFMLMLRGMRELLGGKQ